MTNSTETLINTMPFADALASLKSFINPAQLHVMKSNCKGEEGDYFRAKIIETAILIRDMPQTYGQDGLGQQALVHLHYFTGGCDWHITEKDAGSADDSPLDFQSQAFGRANIGDGGEFGYISIPELLKAGAEFDLYWTPKTLAELK